MRGTWQGSGTWQTTGGGGGIVALVVVLVIIGAVVHAIWRPLVEAAEIAAFTVLAAAAVAAIGGIAWLVYRSRSDRPGASIEARPVYQVPPESRSPLEESDKPAIGPPREVHLHLNVTPGQLAEIMRHYTGTE